MTQEFKENSYVFLHKTKEKGKIIAVTRGIPQMFKVEVIKSFDPETQQRTTQLYTVSGQEISPFIDKKKSNKPTQRKPLPIKVKYFDEEIPKIEKIAIGDWIDLRAAETVELKQFEFKLIPLGIGMKLPKGYEANTVPRSSTFKNFGIIQTNHYSVIDESYCGNTDQWFYPALAMRDTVIEKGDRICQFRINKKMPQVEFITVEELDEVSRGGHGTTGVN